MATRGSALALAQAGQVARALEAAHSGLEVELVPVRTFGDERPAALAHTPPTTVPVGAEPRAPSPLEVEPPPASPAVEAAHGAAPSDKARFVKEIEDALLAGEAELAVHSAKDVPTELPRGLRLVGVPRRVDPRDALCGPAELDALAPGATVGTSSLRRRSQLLALRDDLQVEELRGNVDTRLRRLAAGRYAAVVLASAGLRRLGLEPGAPLAVDAMVPAAGQGCLLLQARDDDASTAALAHALTDPLAAAALQAERALVDALGASCRTPLGAFAEPVVDGLELMSYVGLPDGSHWIRDRLRGPLERPTELGHAAAERLLAAGAAQVLAEAERLGSAPG